MPVNPVLRLAVAAWLRDPAAALSPEQRTWLTTRLQNRAWSPSPNVCTPLAAWATALDARLGAIVQAQIRGEAVAPVVVPRTPQALAFLAGSVRDAEPA